MTRSPVTPDPRHRLLNRTDARLALGRAGAALPTREVLHLALDHARARDAVHAAMDTTAMAADLRARGFETVETRSAAPDRETYLRRPDLGRRLAAGEDTILATDVACDLAVVVGDGLSAAAIHAQGGAFLGALWPWILAAGWRLAPVVLARQARVALGDEIGELLQARAVVVLIGERPGLSSPDSLGAYLTLAPRPGRRDDERNCISNIRPAGLSYDLAAFKLAWLLSEAFRIGCTGVRLKDESDTLLLAGKAPAPQLLSRDERHKL
jgi:ethanolamine ammonia-lyase small subunit